MCGHHTSHWAYLEDIEFFNPFKPREFVLQRTTRDMEMGIFGDHGQSFCPIFTKIGTQGAFMGLRMMLKGFFC